MSRRCDDILHELSLYSHLHAFSTQLLIPVQLKPHRNLNLFMKKGLHGNWRACTMNELGMNKKL